MYENEWMDVCMNDKMKENKVFSLFYY